MGVALPDRGAQRLVERVHRAVALGRLDVALAVDPDLDGGLRLHAAVLALLDDRAPGLEAEQRLVLAGLLADEEVEGAVGGLELVAAALELLDALHHPPGRLVVHARPRLHGALARQLGDEHAPVRAHLGRVEVLERARVHVHAGHVHAALVGEGVGAHVGLVRVRRDVAELVHQVRGLGERAQPLAADRLVAQLELQGGQDRHEVGVPAALPVAVDRALDHARAGLDGHERVGHAAAGVVVGVDAHLDPVELNHHRGGGQGHLARQRGAVRVAERDVLGTCVRGRPEAAQRVGGIVAPGVEEVLRVVDHALALAHEERHRVRDHPQVLLGVHLRDLLQVKRPRLAHQRADRSEGVGQEPERRVVGGAHVAPPGHAEGRHLGVLEALAGEQLEELLLLGVRRREAGLDEVHAERVERMGHAQLLAGGERHALALHAVTQGGVVDQDLLCHFGTPFGLRERADGRRPGPPT